MIAYKFLNLGGVGPYSGFSWPLPISESPGARVGIQGSLELCRNGIHACHPSQLPYWWGVQLWEVELTEPITDAGRMVLSAQGRLLRRVGRWDEPMMRRYAQACAWRVRDRSVGLLRERGLDAPADALAACTALDSLAATATTLADTVLDEVIAGYIADAASFSTGSLALVKTVPYVAAHALGRTAGPEGRPEYGERYRAERQWQSSWLVQHLELENRP